jgi:hypothetical protein
LYKADQPPPPPPFLEIPVSMMEKMLDKTNEIGTIINDSINSIRKNKEKFRSELKDLIDIDQYLINENISTTGSVHLRHNSLLWKSAKKIKPIDNMF